MVKQRRRQAKFYLSEAAIQLLRQASDETTYDMSTLVDMLIKQHVQSIGAPAAVEPEPAPVVKPTPKKERAAAPAPDNADWSLPNDF